MCPWLVGALAVQDNGDTIIQPRLYKETGSRKGQLICEFDKERASDIYTSSVDTSSLLPVKIHEKMTRVDLAMASRQDLPIAAFRVTLFSDHFTIGYRLNHVFYDQSSIVYLFTYLGSQYSGRVAKVPVFQPRSHLVTSDMTYES